MAEKTINELNENKNVLDKEQEKDQSFEDQQAELFKVVYGVPTEETTDEVPEENQEVEEETETEVEETEEEVEEIAASTTEQPKGTKTQGKKGEEDTSDYQKLYNESLSKIQQLEGTISELSQKIQSFGTLNNLINDLGLKDANQERVQTVITNIRQVADDLHNVPSLGQVLNKFYKGELNAEIDEDKVPQDFMPEGYVYSESDAFSDKTSPSYKAYKSFRQWEMDTTHKKQEFLSRIEQERGNKNGVVEGFEKAVKQLVEGFNSTRVDLVNQFPINDDTWNKFIEFYRSGNPLTIKAAFAVFAKENGIESKIDAKLKKNKESKETILNSKTKKDEFYSEGDIVPTTEHDKQQASLMKELGWIN